MITTHIRSLLLLCAVLVGCGSCVSRSEYLSLKSEFDSIAMLNQYYENDSYQTDSIVASVIAHFQELAHIESMVNLNPLSGDMRLSPKRRIQKNVNMLADKLAESNKALENLSLKLSTSQVSNRSLFLTLEMLQQEMAFQQARVERITETTLSKGKEMHGLEATLERLRKETKQLEDYIAQQQDILKAREDALNVVHYAMGTEGDLKEMNLLYNGKVVVDNAQMDYLTEADKRELTSIPMLSRTARLASIHPRSAYELKPDAKGYLILEIKDPEDFWMYSHIMIAIVE